MSSSYLNTIENNIAKQQQTQNSASRDPRQANGASSRPFTTVDPSIPPLRLPPLPAAQPARNPTPTKGNNPVILAPNSSPDALGGPRLSFVPNRSHFAQPTFGTNNFSINSRNAALQDPLSGSLMAKYQYRPPGSQTAEPPRKKQNTGKGHSGQILVPNTPEASPQTQRYSNDGRNISYPSPLDEEESPGPNRLRRGRPEDYAPIGSPSPSHKVPMPTMPMLTLSSMYPDVPQHVLKEISSQVDNLTMAQALVDDWKRQAYSYSVSVTQKLEQEKREKELAKQRKHKSAIYAHRNAVPNPVVSRPKRTHDDSDSGEDEFRDGIDSDGSESSKHVNDTELEALCTEEALIYFNTADADSLVMMIACTPEQADIIIRMRPFHSVDDVENKMVRRSGVTSKLFENYKDLLIGYRAVDEVLRRCEQTGQQFDEVQAVWQKFSHERPKAPKQEADVYYVDEPTEEPSLKRTPEESKIMAKYIWDPPQSLAKDVKLKEYQMLGLNWLNLLYSKNHSCILADEMGLGKTIQVIAFLTYLKDNGVTDKYLIVVPASTLENWIREFSRFSPDMRIVSYYGTINERAAMRRELTETQDTWDVLITTYNFAQGGGNDSKFFKKVPWGICVFDEGHVLKNYQSQRYEALMKIRGRWRLLLTGTPLQNNLQELLSLMNFILPRIFADVVESFRAIFKVKPSAQQAQLAHDRVSRAKRMMTPFVLRRRKDQVLKELPKKTERIEWCEMTALQKEVYQQTMQRSRRVLMEEEEVEDELAIAEAAGQKGRPKKKKQLKAQQQDLSSNVLMDLRKATAHPMLFRRLYTDDQLKVLAKACLQEPEFHLSKYELVLEDMSVMTDAEIHQFCKRYKSVRKYALDEAKHLDAGKVDVVIRLLERYSAEGRRVLIFSQFTQILDILKSVLEHKGYRYLLLTGSTAVDERQGLVDEFNEDDEIKVFLLSTKAGGMGINLTAASVVITYDQDFNPHNDLQASDRAYRIGQQRDVDVIRLITRGTIEEDILALAQTKLALDEAVAGDEEASKQTENEVKKSLIQRLRKQLEQQDQQDLHDPTSLSQATVTADSNKDARTTSTSVENGEDGSKDGVDFKEEEVKSAVGTPNEPSPVLVPAAKRPKHSKKLSSVGSRKMENDMDVLSALPAALLAATSRQTSASASGSPRTNTTNTGTPRTVSPAGSSVVLRVEETPPATQSPTPLPTPPEREELEEDEDVIMVDDD
ncbi:hypothetical protein FRC20_011067 [Serendipita sp. 405]|nr:hypothetical protein FRC20_011067 [Serendipita sp. 405]